jgi:hypothetical protein
MLLLAVLVITWLVTAKFHLGVIAAGLLFLPLSKYLPGLTIQLDQTGIHCWRGNNYRFLPWKAAAFWKIDSHTLFLAPNSLSAPVDYLFAIALPCPLEAELVAQLCRKILEEDHTGCGGMVESSSAPWSDPMGQFAARSGDSEVLHIGTLK